MTGEEDLDDEREELEAVDWSEYRDPAEQAAWLEFVAAGSYDAPDHDWLEAASDLVESDELPLSKEGAGAPSPSDKWHSHDPFAVFESPFPTITMAVPELDLGPGRPCGLWGAPGAGKNVAAQAIALAIMTGRKAFGCLDVERGAVIHLTWDMGFLATALRYRQLANGMGISSKEIAELRGSGRFLLCVHPQIALTARGALKSFAERLEGFDFAIVDNIRAATPQVDENASEFGAYIELLGAAAERAGCTPLYLHHTRKEGSREISTTSGRGSSAILAASGCVWGIEGEGDGPRKLVHLRAHDMGMGLRDPLWLTASEPPSERLSFDTGDRPSFALEARKIDPRLARKRDGVGAKILELLERSPGAGKRQIRAEIKGKAADVDWTIDSLLQLRKIVRDGRNGYRLAKEPF